MCFFSLFIIFIFSGLLLDKAKPSDASVRSYNTIVFSFDSFVSGVNFSRQDFAPRSKFLFYDRDPLLMSLMQPNGHHKSCFSLKNDGQEIRLLDCLG